MYLTEFRRKGVNNFGCLWRDAPDPQVVLDEIDATLNSWAEAHRVFDRHQGDNPTVTNEAFTLMRSQVYSVIRGRLNNSVNSYPVEAFTYALLQRWIEVRQAELKIPRGE